MARLIDVNKYALSWFSAFKRMTWSDWTLGSKGFLWDFTVIFLSYEKSNGKFRKEL